MANEYNEIVLKGGESFITNSATDAYKVKKGSLLIYIAPIRNNRIGRRSFIYEASINEIVPSFCYKDIDYIEWRFCFVASESCVLEIIRNGSTKVLKQRFSEHIKVKNFDYEGYEGGLVDKYKFNIVTEDSFIRRSQKERKTTAEDVLCLIFEAFNKEKRLSLSQKTNSALYDSVKIICNATNIEIAPYEKIKEACGNEINVKDIAHISHFSYRKIVLSRDWYKKDSGAFLVYSQNKEPLVCLPKRNNSYVLYDVRTGEQTSVTKKVALNISPEAYMFYRSLPVQSITRKDAISYAKRSIVKSDVLLLFVLTIAISLIGLLTPTITQKLYDNYIPLGARDLLFQLGCVMASFMMANVLFSIVKNVVNFRITTKMAYDFQGAVYDRLFNLPESFFRRFESADLALRVIQTAPIVNDIGNIFFLVLVSAVFLLVYFLRMISYSVKLSLIALLLVLVYVLAIYFVSLVGLKYKRKSTELEGKTDSIIYQFLNGISKIRIAGAEDRALYEYIEPYIDLRSNDIKYKKISNIVSTMSLVATSFFSMILYISIIKMKNSISLGSFVAFNTLFGSFAAYSIQIVGQLINYKNEKPSMERLKPILAEKPEVNSETELPGEITGEIEINNVVFAYDKETQNVLNGINIKIAPGEYVAIVGPSGCGKSTLLKLLLGFEKPTVGKIYYDNKDIESLDKRELRKKLGVVLQDGKLISGSIFENITITSPEANYKDVEEVIKKVGLEEDISMMPMGLHTVLSEDCGTISGGQQQRILIARVIMSNPSIVYFDEATSALDNVTQRMVCETIENMDSTRLVIAHRLSTIINCDRIIVLNNGLIEEEGTYDELMANKGLFYKMAIRQLT